MPKSIQPVPLSRPPQLYSPSPVPLQPVTTAYNSPLEPTASRSFQGRKVLFLDTSNSDNDLLFPLSSVNTPIIPTIPTTPGLPFLSPGLISPNYRRPNLVAASQQSFIQRKSFAEIIIFTNTQYSLLKTLCSDKILPAYSPEVWEAMLLCEKFPTTNSGQDAYDVEMATVSLAIEFANNNEKTANFNTLLLHCLSQMHRVLMPEFIGDIPVSAYNSLFLVRIFSKHFIGNMTRDEIHRQFEGHCLDDIINKHETNGLTCEEDNHTQIELDLNNLVIDLQVVQDPRPKSEQLLDCLVSAISTLDPINDIDICIKQLVINFVEQKSPPPASTSVVYNAYSYLFPGRSSASLLADPPPIAERSLLVLLLLASQLKKSGQGNNKFRESIKLLKDAQALYQLICRQLPSEEICLILYLFMVENEDFRVYVLSRLDPEILLLQILRLLYDGVEGKTNYSQMYILLTILLLFSQDEVFNENIQKIQITYQPWFTERLLKSISLGGLAYLVLIRVLQYNLCSHRDVYFHTNCLAIMANLGSSIQDIHPYVAQRLVNLFDIVAKRYQKLYKKVQEGEEDNSDDIVIYGDLVCLVLEIINSVLTRRLNSNPELIYSLLHKKDLFTQSNLKSPSAEEISELIETVARTWPPGRLKEFPDLKFQYEEESESQEFFCPYVWSLIHRHTWIYWDEEKARILHDYITPEEPVALDAFIIS
ncbi:24924_t:CDS:10 [Cetraspora pellucida]|uniref:Dymeclin n=1 Tax=Cetraspora pellucida TaxID=1433469 RepID=A0A9N9N6M8_9GLOM|nr:24924_t:CDS:10 [Cetraspora pellucida]